MLIRPLIYSPSLYTSQFSIVLAQAANNMRARNIDLELRALRFFQVFQFFFVSSRFRLSTKRN